MDFKVENFKTDNQFGHKCQQKLKGSIMVGMKGKEHFHKLAFERRATTYLRKF